VEKEQPRQRLPGKEWNLDSLIPLMTEDDREDFPQPSDWPEEEPPSGEELAEERNDWAHETACMLLARYLGVKPSDIYRGRWYGLIDNDDYMETIIYLETGSFIE
jgi:hypothetical protein